jgi:hypothetical protein
MPFCRAIALSLAMPAPLSMAHASDGASADTQIGLEAQHIARQATKQFAWP